MRLALGPLLMSTLLGILVGCGGSVDEGMDGAAGRATPGVAGAATGVGDAGGDDAAGTPVASIAGRRSVRVLPAEPVASRGGAAGESADAGGGAESTLTPTVDLGPAEITSTVVDAPLMPRGFLSGLQYRPNPDSASVYSIEASFETTRGQWDGCTQVRRGECWYYDCPPGSAPYLPSVPLEDAGALALSTSTEPVATVNVGLLYDFWYQADGTAELWSGRSQTLTFSAAGSVVPPFSLSIQSPPTVILTALNGEALPKSIAREDGATLSWTSSGPGLAYFSVYGFYDRKFAAVCEFDAAANAGVLPAVLLQELEPGPDYYLTFHGTTRARASVQGWELDAALAGYGGPRDPFDVPRLELR